MKKILILFLFIIFVVAVHAAENVVQPSFLKKGDKVALISPSYYIEPTVVSQAADVLKKWGLVPVIGNNVGKKYAGKYAGTPQERAEDLLWALHDDEVKAVICNRGGYGAVHLIDFVPLKEFAEHPKWFVGFSDITTIHSFLSVAGVMSIHGTMPKEMVNAKGNDQTSLLLKNILFGNIPEYQLRPNRYNLKGNAEGTLVGGNLCVLSALGGSFCDATNKDGIILFLEEIGENKRNIDRLFNTLKVRGVLSRVKGIILGEFIDAGNDLSFESVEQMLYPYLEKLNIPVCCGFPAGHGDINFPLIHGATVQLDVNQQGASIRFSKVMAEGGGIVDCP